MNKKANIDMILIFLLLIFLVVGLTLGIKNNSEYECIEYKTVCKKSYTNFIFTGKTTIPTTYYREVSCNKTHDTSSKVCALKVKKNKAEEIKYE